jgi:hypothetical protein
VFIFYVTGICEGIFFFRSCLRSKTLRVSYLQGQMIAVMYGNGLNTRICNLLRERCNVLGTFWALAQITTSIYIQTGFIVSVSNLSGPYNAFLTSTYEIDSLRLSSASILISTCIQCLYMAMFSRWSFRTEKISCNFEEAAYSYLLIVFVAGDAIVSFVATIVHFQNASSGFSGYIFPIAKLLLTFNSFYSVYLHRPNQKDKELICFVGAWF